MQDQVTTNTNPNKIPLLNFSLIVKGKNLQTRSETPEIRISVFCEMCDSQDSGTRSELIEKGWGLYGGQEYCPTDNASV